MCPASIQEFLKPKNTIYVVMNKILLRESVNNSGEQSAEILDMNQSDFLADQLFDE